MKPAVENDFKWADRYMAHVRCILGQHVLRIGTAFEDMHQCGDLRILRVDSNAIDYQIGVRIRRAKVWEIKKYRQEFTLRARRRSGATTELEKITEFGLCTWLFYGFARNDEERLLRAYHIIDIEKLRPWLKLNMTNLKEIANKDNETSFIPVCIDDIRKDTPEAIIASVELCDGMVLRPCSK